MDTFSILHPTTDTLGRALLQEALVPVGRLSRRLVVSVSGYLADPEPGGATMQESPQLWTVEYEGDEFERFYTGLPEYEQAVLTAAITHVLKLREIDICGSEWGKPLGDGLYEFRVRRSLQAILAEAGSDPPADLAGADRQVLLRIHCHFHGARIVLLLGGYDKGRDGSDRRQQNEIRRARKALARWRRSRP